MKKLLLIIFLLIPFLLFGQQTFNKNIVIQKTTPMLYLKGSGGSIDFNGKKLSVLNTLTLAGTDATTMTFPSTSATIARTDAANTFTGHQTIEAVTSTGATGAGNLVFSASPTFTGTVVGITAAMTGSVALADSVGSATGTYLSGRDAVDAFALKINIADTSAMLTSYAKNTSVALKANIDAPAFTTSIAIGIGDTTTALKGKIIFLSADSSFYGCRSTLAAKKWYKLDN